MSSFSSITDALDLMVPPFDAGGDWQGIVRRAIVGDAAERRDRAWPLWPRRPRTLAAAALLLVLVALVATPALGVQGFVLDLLGRKNVSFQQSRAAPNEVKKQFEDLAIGAPARWAPEALAKEARTAGTFVIAGHRRRLWVVPTRRGGYCYTFEKSFGGCRQTSADRAIGTKGQFGVTSQWKSQPNPGWPILTRIGGDLTAPQAARITIHYTDGTSTDVPFLWVSKPIAAGFFSYDIPTSHWTVTHRVVSVTLQARDGRQLGSQTFPYQRRVSTPHLPQTIVTPQRRVLPTTPPVAPSQPIQQGTADGFAVTVGHNGAVQFAQIAQTADLHRLVGHSVSFGCFRLTREFGIFTVRGMGQEARFAGTVGFQLNGVSAPVDGCDIEGSAGHLWPDRNSSHSAVEVGFTSAGQAFFADRASARDLALFVRSRRVHSIRREPAAKALQDLHTVYGRQLAHSRIRIATRLPNQLIFSERSTTGKTFTVVVRNGRIARQNLRPYGFVF